MYITDTECTFVFDEVLKHSRSIYCQKHLIFRAYLKYPELYPVKKLIKLSRYKINKNVKFSTFFSTTKPFKPVSRDTIAR